MTAEALHFQGNARRAALVILDETPLSDLGNDYAADDGTLLTVTVPDDHVARLSSGERHLWMFLCSLSGHGTVNVWSLVFAIDTPSQLAVWRAIGELVGVATVWGEVAAS